MKLLKEVFPGSIVKVERDSLMEDWIVVEQSETITTLLRKNTIPKRWSNPTSPVTYEGDEIDSWLNNETDGFLAGFSAATRTKLVRKPIATSVYNMPEHLIYRFAFIPSTEELDVVKNDGEPNKSSWFFPLAQLTGSFSNSAKEAYSDIGGKTIYPLRTPGSDTSIMFIWTSGNFYASSTNNISYIRPAIAVSGDCLVGDDNVLLPDDDKPYREVELIGIADHMSYRPTVARVEVNAVNLYDVEVQVTNNAKDETPVWVDAVGGNTVEFTNTEKTSELWELGVRLYGKSDGIGYFTEPIIIIKEDTGNG